MPVVAALAATLLFTLPQPGAAHESDQYSLPVGREFADLGPYFSVLVQKAVETAVAITNAEIADAVHDERPGLLPYLQSTDYIAHQVWAQLFTAFPSNEVLDARLVSQSFRAAYPGLVTLHWPVPSIYDDPLLVVDFSKLVRTFFRAGTVSAGGTLVGTDKFIHFINLGRIYHAAYETQRGQGQAHDRAIAKALAGIGANPLLSEDGVLGLMSTGIRSNGDLAANYAGFKFYLNLTQAVSIGTRTMPPMLQRDGEFWRVRIQPGSDFFTAFVTPHWNEVLNPNRYLDYVAWRMPAVLREHCPDVIEAYVDDNGRHMDPSGWTAMATQLGTYFGEPYDHQPHTDNSVTAAGICFTDQGSRPADDAAEPPFTDELGRTALWWASRGGQIDLVERQLESGVDVNASDADGETALHAATRSGSVPVVQRLLRSGADPNAAAMYGTTPLLLAAMRGDVATVQVLLDAGADPNRPGAFGTTPLHAVVYNDNTALERLLVRRGARTTTADDLGQSALAIARRRALKGLDDGSWQDDPMALTVTDHAEPRAATGTLEAGHAR